MEEKPTIVTSSRRGKRPYVDPATAPPDTDHEAADETSIETKIRLAREKEADRKNPADRDRVIADLRGSRLSPPVLLILVAAAFALIVFLLVFGGVI